MNLRKQNQDDNGNMMMSEQKSDINILSPVSYVKNKNLPKLILNIKLNH